MAEYNVRKFDKNIAPKDFVAEGYEKVVLTYNQRRRFRWILQ